jgi:hypothetical protein
MGYNLSKYAEGDTFSFDQIFLNIDYKVKLNVPDSEQSYSLRLPVTIGYNISIYE